MRLTDEQLDWLCARLPSVPARPRGGRPPMDRRKVIAAIFWILDNGAKWKDLPRHFGSRSAVHAYFQGWAQEGVFENIMRDAGLLVEERGGYRLYECFIDATFSKARGGGDGVGVTKAGKGVKIMVLVDARGLPVAVTTGSASPHESTLVQGLFDFMLSTDTPTRIVGDKAYDSDVLDEDLDDECIELIAPHRRNRKPQNITQDGRRLRRYKRRWTVERTISWFQNFRRLCIRYEKSTTLFQGFLHLGCSIILLKQVYG
ncbi:MAG: IS5 family transposase [Planctomycetes bacterium]|nr:IS5 family transposase [Planctomycetota bacterium]